LKIEEFNNNLKEFQESPQLKFLLKLVKNNFNEYCVSWAWNEYCVYILCAFS